METLIPVHKALLISDLHLGSPVCQAEVIRRVIEESESEIILIVGDLFDGPDLKRLAKKHWKVLSALRKASKSRRVILVRGNHDPGGADFLEALLGIETVNEFLLEHDGKRFLFIHGDIFDSWVSQWPITSEIFTGVYNFLQRLDPLQQRIARYLKHRSKDVTRCVQTLRKRAEEYRKHKKADFICCGHSHYEEITPTYANAGCFTDSPCTYATLAQDTSTENCGVTLHHAPIEASAAANQPQEAAAL